MAKQGAFSLCHPVVPALYLLVALALTMFSLHPVLVGCSLVGAMLYCCLADGVVATLQSLRWQLPLIVLIALLNPLFSASGSTELFRIGASAVYLESLLYGCCMGALFVASVTWFRAGASMLSFDKVMALFGNAAPTICLMISMCMRLIPRFVRTGKLVLATQDANMPAVGVRAASTSANAVGAVAGLGHGTSGSVATTAKRAGFAGQLGHNSSVRTRLRASSVLMGWSMEDSLETADSMRARGWNSAARRTTYTRYRFTSTDAFALGALVLFGALCLYVAYAAMSAYHFYPQMSELRLWWGYLPYAAWMLLPSCVLTYERRMFG